MNVQFFYPDGKQVLFKEIDARKYRGTLLPGSDVQQNTSWAAVITVQEFQSRMVNIGHRLLDIFSKIKFSINEPGGLRLEALLSGETYISVNGNKRKFKAGEYRLTNVPLFKALFKRNTSCSLFISYYSSELLTQLGIDITPCMPQRMPDKMMNLMNDMLRNPYSEKLRNFYYENGVRELLFFHLAQDREPTPGELKDKDIALIYKADSIISSNLQKHYTIDELAKMVSTNSLKLKLGFNKLYGMGVFQRLVFRRMEHAKVLLETTDKPINEIATHAGYDSAASFIHAFRKAFGFTPREWRIQERKADNENEDID
jgi:AraC-like DNA-binding protein